MEPEVKAIVEEHARTGVTKIDCYRYCCSQFEGQPSYPAFFKCYGPYWDYAKTGLDSEIGGKLIQAAKDGDPRSIEFYLERKAGWRKEDVNIEVEATISEEDKISARESLFDRIIPKKEEKTDDE